MKKNTTLRVGTAVALLIAAPTIIVGTLGWANDPLTVELVAAGIRDGLNRSPDHFVAALIEVTSQADCQGISAEAGCTQECTAVQVFVSHGTALVAGDRFRVAGKGRVGSRTLAFLVPLPPTGDVYGATFQSARAGVHEQRVFTEALKVLGLWPVA